MRSGVLAKVINLGLAPLVAYIFVSMAWRKQLVIRQALIGLVVLTAGAAAISLHTFYFNLMHFGMLTPMQEAVENRAEGRTLSDYVEAATELDWWHHISRRYLRHSLWRGGWSMLSAPRWLARSSGNSAEGERSLNRTVRSSTTSIRSRFSKSPRRFGA